jgi:hypothetical protein
MTEVVLLELAGGRARAVRHEGAGGPRRQAVAAADPLVELRRLVAGHPEAVVGWFEAAVESWLAPFATWPALLRHDLELLHLGAIQGSDRAAPSLGRVEFETSDLLGAPADRRFPSWLVSPLAGCCRGRLLRAAGLDRSSGPFVVALSALARRGLPSGLCPYSEPALLARPVPAAIAAEWRLRLGDGDAARLVREAHGGRWLLFWGLGRLVFDRRLPLTALLLALLRRRGAVVTPPLAELHPAAREPAPGEVAVVVPTLGRPDALRALLDDLAGQTHPPARVVVVEQRPPGTPAAAGLDAGGRPFALVHRVVPWSGACRARNLGMTLAAGDWLLLLDDDVRLPATLVHDLLATAAAYGVDVVNAGVRHAHRPAAPSADRRPRLWPNFSSGAALLSRAAVADAGPFDERLESGYGEDYELGVRLRLAGHPVLLAPAAEVLHLQLAEGGLRHPVRYRWDEDRIPPRPSPTVLYSREKHATPAMREGYRLFYTLGRLAAERPWRWPLAARRIQREWSAAALWRERVQRGEPYRVVPTEAHGAV